MSFHFGGCLPLNIVLGVISEYRVMEFEKLFQVVVEGGSVLTASQTDSAVRVHERDESLVDPRESYTPNEAQNGAENCCWLMTVQDECCA